MTRADLVGPLVGLLILFLGISILARQRHGKLLAVVAAVAGAVLALFTVEIANYVVLIKTPDGYMPSGMVVRVGGFVVLDLRHNCKEPGAIGRSERLADVLNVLVAGAGALSWGALGCALGTLEQRHRRLRREPSIGNPPGPPQSHG